MLNLIKLEIKKFKLKDIIKGVSIANIIVISILTIILFGAKNEQDIPFKNLGEFLSLSDTIVRAIFIIYASTLLSKLIIDEFNNKTINLMFVYPINRKKILISKLLIVAAFTFVTVIFSNIVVALILNGINEYANFLPSGLTLSVLINTGVHIFINAIAAAGIALIPLFFGMRKKSTRATIVSAVILVSLVCSNNGGKLALTSILPISISLGLIGLSVAYFTIRNIETIDIY